MKQEAVPLIPDKKPSAEDINLITIEEPKTTNISSTPPNSDNEDDSKDTDIEAQHTPADKILAVVKEIPEEINPLTETQLQPEDTEDPPISFGEDLQDLAWIDAEEDPWEYCIQQGCIYNI